jgi:DNA-binding GntR family transcriptional regulator
VQAHIGGVLASRAADHISDEQLRELERVQDQLEVAYRDDDPESAVRLNHEFHRGVNVAAGSPKLAQLMGQITRFALESVYPTVEGWPAHSMRDHRLLLAALKKRDGEAARAAMSEHLCAAAEPLIDHLTQRGVIG